MKTIASILAVSLIIFYFFSVIVGPTSLNIEPAGLISGLIALGFAGTIFAILSKKSKD